MARSIASKSTRQSIGLGQTCQLPPDIWVKIFEYCFSSTAVAKHWPSLLEKSASPFLVDQRAVGEMYASLCVSRSHHALAKAFLYECVEARSFKALKGLSTSMKDDYSLGSQIHHLGLSYTAYAASFPHETGFHAMTPKALYERQQSVYEQWQADAYLVTRVAANVRSLCIDFGDVPQGCDGAKLLRAIKECCHNLRILHVRNASPLADTAGLGQVLESMSSLLHFTLIIDAGGDWRRMSLPPRDSDAPSRFSDLPETEFRLPKNLQTLTFHDFSALQWPLSASLLGCTGLTSIHCQVQDPDSSFPAIASLVSHYSTQLVTLSIKALSRSRRDDVMGSLFADTSFTTLKELGLFRANHRPIDDLLVHTNGRTFPQLSSLYLEATIWAEVEVLLKRASLRNVHYLEMLDYSGRASRNAEVQLARIAEQLDIKMHIHSAGCDCTKCLVDGGLATLIR